MPKNMEHRKKATIAKLKSSNSAIENKKKTETHKKISKSNAEIEMLGQKKRGVYVEKNKTSMFGRDIYAADEIKEDIEEKPPKRPHRDHKKFLASVLTILSKSSTGIHQTSFNNKARKDEMKHQVSPNHTLDPSHIPSYGLDCDLDKKKKYRSKILNDYKHQVDNFEVIQSKKERFGTGTSSNSSVNDKEDTKWKSQLPRLVPLAPEDIENDDKYKTLVREVKEGKKLAEKKTKVFDPDPPTLVAEQATHRDEKKLYNFFVDLLQGTFNDYTENAQFGKGPSTVSSKIALEINESVARKLNVATEMHKENGNVCELPVKIDYSVRNKYSHWNNNSLQYNTQFTRTPKYARVIREPKSAGKQTKTRKEYEPRRVLSMRSQRAEFNKTEKRPSFYRKNKKRDMLNLLKEELRMDPVSFEAPQNLYQALKVMAEQKRKPEKALNFRKKNKKTTEKYPAEGMLLKGRSMLNKKPLTRNDDDTLINGAIGKKKSELGGHRKIIERSEEFSNHSLKVYSFERFAPNSSQENEACKFRPMRRRMLYKSYPRARSSSEEEF